MIPFRNFKRKLSNNEDIPINPETNNNKLKITKENKIEEVSKTKIIDHTPESSSLLLKPKLSYISKQELTREKLEQTLGDKVENLTQFNQYASPQITNQLTIKTAFQVLADYWGKGRIDPEGKKLEGVCYKDLIEYQSEIIKNIQNRETSFQKEELDKLASSSNSMFKYIQLIDSTTNRQPLEYDGLLKELKQDLASLKSGQSLFIPGGWTGVKNQPPYQENMGHAMVYQIEKVCDNSGNESFYFRILNTGAGIETYHPSKRIGYKELYTPFVEWQELTLPEISNNHLWKSLFDARIVPAIKAEERPIYQSLHIYETCARYLPVEKKAPAIPPLSSDLITPQRAGTCTDKAQQMIPKVLLGRSKTKVFKIEKSLITAINLYQKCAISDYSQEEMSLALEILEHATTKIAGTLLHYKRSLNSNLTPSEKHYVEHATATLVDLMKHIEKLRKDLGGQNIAGRAQGFSYEKFVDASFAGKENMQHIQNTIPLLASEILSQTSQPDIPLITLPIPVAKEAALPEVTFPKSAAEAPLFIAQLKTSLDIGLKLKDTSPEAIAAFLALNVFDKLPIPNSRSNEWKALQNPKLRKECMSVLFDLQTFYFNTCFNFEKPLPEQIVNIWKLYRINIELIRQDKSPHSLANENFAYSALSNLLSCKDFTPCSGKIEKQIQELHDSFYEDYIAHLNNQTAFFDYDQCIDGYTLTSFKETPEYRWCSLSAKKLIFANDNEGKLFQPKWLKAKASNSEQLFTNFMSLTNGYTIKDLDKGIDYEKSTMDPLPYFILRSMAMITQVSIRGQVDKGNTLQRDFDSRNKMAANFELSILPNKSLKYHFPYGYFPQHKIANMHYWDKLEDPCIDVLMKRFFQDSKTQSRIKNEVLANLIDIPSETERAKTTPWTNQKFYEFLETSEVASLNSTVMFLDLFEKNPEYLFSESYQNYFKTLLFTYGRLNKEIQSEPELAARIYQFLEKMLHEDANKLREIVQNPDLYPEDIQKQRLNRFLFSLRTAHITASLASTLTSEVAKTSISQLEKLVDEANGILINDLLENKKWSDHDKSKIVLYSLASLSKSSEKSRMIKLLPLFGKYRNTVELEDPMINTEAHGQISRFLPVLINNDSEKEKREFIQAFLPIEQQHLLNEVSFDSMKLDNGFLEKTQKLAVLKSEMTDFDKEQKTHERSLHQLCCSLMDHIPSFTPDKQSTARHVCFKLIDALKKDDKSTIASALIEKFIQLESRESVKNILKGKIENDLRTIQQKKNEIKKLETTKYNRKKEYQNLVNELQSKCANTAILAFPHLIVFTKDKNIFQIDLFSGRVSINGELLGENVPQEEFIQSAKIARVSSGLEQPMIKLGNAYHPLTESWKHLNFYLIRDIKTDCHVSMDLSATDPVKRYWLLSPEQIQQLQLPKNLEQSAFSFWVNASAKMPEILICNENEEGIPQPVFKVVSEGKIVLFDKNLIKERSDLYLINLDLEANQKKLQFLKGLAPQFNFFAWGDKEGHLKKIELPLINASQSNQSPDWLVFEKEGETFKWKQDPHYHIASEQKLSSLVNYPNFLILENQEGEKKVLLSLESILASQILNAKKVDMAQIMPPKGIPKNKFLECTLSPEGELKPHNTEGALCIAYLKMMQGDYADTLKLLKESQPFDRRYSYEELTMMAAIGTISESGNFKVDNSAEANALRIYCAFLVRDNLWRFPLSSNDYEILKNDYAKLEDSYIKIDLLTKWIDTGWGDIRKEKKWETQLQTYYKNYLTNKKPIEALSLDKIFEPIEEFRLLHDLVRTNCTIGWRIRKRYLDLYQQGKGFSLEKTRYGPTLSSKGLMRNDEITLGFKHQDIYRNALFGPQKTNLQEMPFTWGGEEFCQYFREAYRIATNGTLQEKEALSFILAARQYENERLGCELGKSPTEQPPSPNQELYKALERVLCSSQGIPFPALPNQTDSDQFIKDKLTAQFFNDISNLKNNKTIIKPRIELLDEFIPIAKEHKESVLNYFSEIIIDIAKTGSSNFLLNYFSEIIRTITRTGPSNEHIWNEKVFDPLANVMQLVENYPKNYQDALDGIYSNLKDIQRAVITYEEHKTQQFHNIPKPQHIQRAKYGRTPTLIPVAVQSLVNGLTSSSTRAGEVEVSEEMSNSDAKVDDLKPLAQSLPASLDKALKACLIEPQKDSEKKVANAPKLMALEEYNLLNEADKKAIDLLQKDLDAFSQLQEKNKSPQINESRLSELKLALREEGASLEKQIKSEEQEILKIANNNSRILSKPLEEVLSELQMSLTPVDMPELIGMLLQGRKGIYEERTSLYADEIQDLQQKTMEYLVKQTQWLQIQRSLEAINKLDACKKVEERRIALQEAAKTLIAPIAYDPAKNPEFLIYEYYADIRISPEQAGLLQHLVETRMQPGFPDKYVDKVIQLIMGGGKSKVLLPILAFKAADADHISAIIVPSALYGSTKDDFAKTFQEKLGRKIEVLEFNREECSMDYLQRLEEVLMRAQQQGRVIITRPTDLHSLNLMLIDRHEQIYQFNKKWEKRLKKAYENPQLSKEEKDKVRMDYEISIDKIKNEREEAQKLKSILHKLNTRLVSRFDEFDSTFHTSQQTTYPVGKTTSLNANGVAAACSLYFELLPSLESIIHLTDNQQTLLDEKTYADKVLPELVDKLWDKYASRLTPQGISKEAFKQYLTFEFRQLRDEKSVSPEEYKQATWVFQKLKDLNVLPAKGKSKKKYAALADELAFYKYALSKELLDAFRATGHVKYGRSQKNAQQEIVIPCDRSIPKEGAFFRNPWETVFKTSQYYRQTWNDPMQTQRLIKFWLNLHQTTKGDTFYIKNLESIFGNLKGLDLSDKIVLDHLTKRLNEKRKVSDPVALSLIGGYLRKEVFSKQVSVYPVQISSNPQDLGGISQTTQGCSGTRGGENGWPDQIVCPSALGVDGKTVAALCDPKNSETTILIGKTPIDVVTELWNQDPHAFDDVSAWIDQGPLFKGIDNLKVAEDLLKVFAEKGINKKAVFTYAKNSKGESQLSLLCLLASGKIEGPIFIQGTDKKAIKDALGGIKEEEVLTFYPHAQIIGSDIPQPILSKAIVTFGDQNTKDLMLQAVMRMRQLGVGAQFVKYLIPVEAEEKVRSVMKISIEKKSIQTKDLVNYSQIMQRRQEKKENLQAVHQQMQYAPKDYFRKELIKPKLNPFTNELLGESQAQLIEEDIYAQSRSLFVMKQSTSLFEQYGRIETTCTSKEFLEQQISQITDPLSKIRVTGFDSEKMKKELERLVNGHLTIKQTALPEKVQVNSIQAAGAEMEVHVRTEQKTFEEQEQHTIFQGLKECQEKTWKKKPLSNDLVPAQPFSQLPDGQPALYRLNQMLPAAKKGFGEVFSDSILVTENFIHSFIGNEIDLLTPEQKPVHSVLIVEDLVNGKWQSPKFVLLSATDHNAFAAQLAKKQAPKNKRAWIVEAHGQAIQSASDKWINNERYQKGLLETLIFKGDVTRLEECKEEFTQWLKQGNTRDKCLFFERLMDINDEDNQKYKISPLKDIVASLYA
jgi:Protein of unknown function (DUF3638)